MSSVPHGDVDLAEAVPALVGSILSAIGTLFILATYYFIPPNPTHIRHTLIRNLAVAEFGLHFTTSISGFMIVGRGRDLNDGPGCVLSGFTTQLFSTAIDFNMLVILMVLSYMTYRGFNLKKPRRSVTLGLIITPWLFPSITAIIGLAENLYHPVSGNWCWVDANPVYLRFVFKYGSLFAIMIALVAMGLFIRIYLLKQKVASPEEGHRPEVLSAESEKKDKPQYTCSEVEIDAEAVSPTQSDKKDKNEYTCTEVEEIEVGDEDEALVMSERRRTLQLLSGYPIFYVILWLPGIANRVAEATGHPSRALAIAQSTNSYVGFANAVTFGWSEVRRQFGVHKMLELTLGFILSG
ncbi:uncharacterized protein LY89DRAFT_721442 [Mollisia scopiformis]|uniref:Uncharacterized protein n=1 Tax=Mollisia scopiformis TaxID=149040 RepID=A0A194X0N9_MOLSC|nr:uncharacterized protein LY89DRAFT_721442 [Mollisia scopiformis]KUJ13432.1 hypothetical protein LY89DRAFT_721442 [Mollisia scopiformis]